MSYRMRIDQKSQKSARFISGLQKKVQKALVASGKTQQEIAEILGVDRSVINRRLKGSANLTARSIAELAYALDKDLLIEFVDKEASELIPKRNTWTGKVSSFERSTNSLSHGTVTSQAKFVLERTGS
ncbi:MAG: helix-turn-helix transcriptional regulator [Octadecabacter sp.]|nr:helix-turn-helix transcriptional regulator [Octadecabacter sp.]